MNKEISKRIPQIVLFILFTALSIWWFILFFVYGSKLLDQNLLWAALYQITALWGAFWGIVIYRSWGGIKSVFGRAILMFSIGLLLQNFGQTVFSIYNLFLKIDVPYPSLADIGFFGSIPFYIYGAYLIGCISGVRITLRTYLTKAVVFIVPLVLLIISYVSFLKDYQFDSSNPIKTFLDFGYPLGQALYISLALLAFIFSNKFLGGTMKKAMLLILGGLFMQYVADFNFLFQASNGSWVNGGYGDFLYLISYTTMAISLIKLDNFYKIIRLDSASIVAIHPQSNTSNTKKLFNQILVEIIKSQERVAGSLAWEEVKKVSGISIVDELKFVVSIEGDSKEIINELVYGYQKLFGTIASDVSKNAVRYLIAELPDDEVPESLK